MAVSGHFEGKKYALFGNVHLIQALFPPAGKNKLKKTSFHQFNHLDFKLAEKNWWKNYIKTRGFLKSVLHERS